MDAGMVLVVGSQVEPWFSEPMAGVIGGVLGAGYGGVLCGGIGGGVFGSLASLGKCVAAAKIYFKSMIALGLVIAGVGLIALLMDQPRHVWYSILFPGALGAFITGVVYPSVLARIRDAEQRRLEAASVRSA